MLACLPVHNCITVTQIGYPEQICVLISAQIYVYQLLLCLHVVQKVLFLCVVTVFTMLAYMLLFPHCCMYIITSMHDLGRLKHTCILLPAQVCIYRLYSSVFMFFKSFVLVFCTCFYHCFAPLALLLFLLLPRPLAPILATLIIASCFFCYHAPPDLTRSSSSHAPTLRSSSSCPA